MLDRLARRIEVRTAEIRGNDSAPAAGDPPAEQPPDALLAPPPADHTPAWGRLAELSARFDANLEPIVTGAPADVVPDGTVDESFSRPPTDDESTSDSPDQAATGSGAPSDETDGDVRVDIIVVDSVETVAVEGDAADIVLAESDAADIVLAESDAAGLDVAEEPMIELFSPHSDLGTVDDESDVSDLDVDEPNDSSVASAGAQDAGENEDSPVDIGDAVRDDASDVDPDQDVDADQIVNEDQNANEHQNVDEDRDDDGLPLTPDGFIAAEAAADTVAAVGEPAMFEAAIAAESTADDDQAHDVGTNTETVLSAAADRLAAPTDDRIEPSLAGLEALGRTLDNDDADHGTGHTLDQLAVVPDAVDPPGSIETSAELPVAVALADEDWTGWSPDATPGQAPRPTIDGAGRGEHDHADDDLDLDEPGVHHGPRWYRQRIRQFGVVAGLVPMVILGGAAALALGSGGGALGGQLGLLLGTSAAPGLLIAGAPFANSNTYPYAAVGSIPIWLVLGWVARRRTLRRPVADWRDYAGQLAWLTVAVILGVAAALTIAAIRIGGPLLG